MDEVTNEWNKEMNEWMHGRNNEWMKKEMNEWTSQKMNKLDKEKKKKSSLSRSSATHPERIRIFLNLLWPQHLNVS